VIEIRFIWANGFSQYSIFPLIFSILRGFVDLFSISKKDRILICR